MSRPQQTAVYNTGAAENKNYTANANTGFNTAQQDIDTYGNAVGAFKAANPYVQGGAVQTAQNQELSDVAAGGAQRAGQLLQGQAVRTGQNAGGAIAATKEMQAENERALGGQEAEATLARTNAGVGYGEAGIGMQGQQEGMEANLANQQGQLAAGAMSEEEKAAQTPSFLDELGQGLIQAGPQAAKFAAMG
jgi:hypothetical protein